MIYQLGGVCHFWWPFIKPKSIDRLINQSINQSINQPTTQSLNQPVTQSSRSVSHSQPISQSVLVSQSGKQFISFNFRFDICYKYDQTTHVNLIKYFLVCKLYMIEIFCINLWKVPNFVKIHNKIAYTPYQFPQMPGFDSRYKYTHWNHCYVISQGGFDSYTCISVNCWVGCQRQGTRAPSQYKDRLIYVWRFPC